MISLEGENGKDLTERVISYLNEDVTFFKNAKKDDGGDTTTVECETSAQVVCNELSTEVSEINQHIVETKVELRPKKENFAEQLDQLKQLSLNGGTQVIEYCPTRKI